MPFKKILPRVGKSSNSIRVSFTGNKTPYANIYIGKDVLEELKWQPDGRVYIYHDDENPRLWLIEEANKEDKKESFKLVSSQTEGARISKLQFRFNAFKPKEEDKKLKDVDYEIKDNKILIKN
jgi:hypothetical protein